MAATWPDTLPAEVPEAADCKTIRRLRPDELDEMVAAYQTGATTRQLAARFGVYRMTISKLLRDRGVNLSEPAIKLDDVKEAAQLYESGWSLLRLAERYDVGQTTIRRHLATVGVVFRPRGRHTGTA
jgi:transposase-like protein